MIAPRGAGVSLNILSKLWRHLRSAGLDRTSASRPRVSRGIFPRHPAAVLRLVPTPPASFRTPRRYLGKYARGYEVMGYVVIASAALPALIRIKGQTHMFGSLE